MSRDLWRGGLGSVVVLLLVVGACSSHGEPPVAEVDATTTTTDAPTTTTTPATTTTTAVVLPEPVPVQWIDCGGGFDCATVAVPIDYQDPAAGTLDLALIRRPAGDPANRIGTLMMNPGGPGASGVRRVRRGFQVSPEVAARFDIVGFDPRGVGDSTPISCGASVAAFRQTDLGPDTPEEHATLEAAARAVAEECAASEGARLAHLGSHEVVHDIEVIRRALGEETVSFIGLSYGTMLGALWADAYPTSVRALVLDGVVDPSAMNDATGRDQTEAIADTVGVIDTACADAGAACPVGQGSSALDSYDELARRIEAGELSGHGVGPTQLAYAVFSATYGEDRWPLLWQAIADGLNGDLSGVASMASWFTGLVEYAPFAIVTCLDSEHPTGYEAWQEAADEAERVSPRFGRVAVNELLPCAFLPATSLEPRQVTAAGAAPILVVGSTGDAATPFEQAVRVADMLDSGVLLTVDIDGHIALGDSACATDAITRYLVDLTVPAAGTRC